MDYTPQERLLLQRSDEYQSAVRLAGEMQTFRSTNLFHVTYNAASDQRSKAISEVMLYPDSPHHIDTYNKGIVAGLDSVLIFQDPDAWLAMKAREVIGAGVSDTEETETEGPLL